MEIKYKLDNVQIDRIYKSDKNQEGEPYVSSKGNPFKKVDIYIDAREIEDTDFKGKVTYFDYFDNSTTWEIGSSLSGEVVKNGQYFNFQLPASGKKALELDFKELDERVKKLENKVFGHLSGHSQDTDEAIKFAKEVYERDEEPDEEDLDLPF